MSKKNRNVYAGLIKDRKLLERLKPRDIRMRGTLIGERMRSRKAQLGDEETRYEWRQFVSTIGR